MRPFGSQGFLNPPSSADSGWWKFSVRRSTKKDAVGRVNAVVLIADCSSRADLNFEVWGISKGKFTKDDVRLSLKDVKLKRAKIEKFRKAVNSMADALLVAYEESEAELNDLLMEPEQVEEQ